MCIRDSIRTDDQKNFQEVVDDINKEFNIHELTEEAGIRYAVMDFSLERQENSREPEDYIPAPLFPVSEITPDGLAERIREADAAYKAWVEAEDAAARDDGNMAVVFGTESAHLGDDFGCISSSMTSDVLGSKPELGSSQNRY